MSFEENKYYQAKVEYKKPIFTKSPVKRKPIIEKIKIKKPIILPTSFKEIKVINEKNNFENVGYNNTYLPLIVNTTTNNDYFTTTNLTYNNDNNVISNNNDYNNTITYGQTETIIDNNNYNNVAAYDTNTLEINNYEDNIFNKTTPSKAINYNNLISDQTFTNTNNYTYKTITEDTTAAIRGDITYDNNALYNNQNTILTNDKNYKYENTVVTNDNSNIDLNTPYNNVNYNIYTNNNISPYSITTFEQNNDKNKNNNISVEIETDSANYIKYYNTINYENNRVKNIKITKIK